VEKAFVAGHSMGGYVAQACMELYPNRFKGLILLNSVPFPDAEEKKADREREISLIQSSMLNRIAEISIPRMYDSDNLRNLDEKIQETIELCETHDPKGIVASLRGMMQRKDYSSFIKDITGKTPILFVYGNKDKFNPIERVNAIIDEFKGVTIRVIEDTGHNSFIEKPQETADIITDFIG
jgi:pimeloyl-ACP methyl ester carboxylesterase